MDGVSSYVYLFFHHEILNCPGCAMMFHFPKKMMVVNFSLGCDRMSNADINPLFSLYSI